MTVNPPDKPAEPAEPHGAAPCSSDGRDQRMDTAIEAVIAENAGLLRRLENA
ncbi:hypothetical protein [Arthrobacter sp. KK5.5]|uniref:hypothetical protein n=1 Tax=Arthrobacter sp. KK5.5 TaxID=3373084 RepID=UPI003EE65689